MTQAKFKHDVIEMVLHQEKERALLYHEMGKNEQAVTLLEHGLAKCKKLVGTQHIYTAYALKNLAHFNQILENYPEAIAYYEQAISIAENILGTKHPATQNLANTYYECQLEKLIKIPLEEALAEIPPELSQQFIQLRQTLLSQNES